MFWSSYLTDKQKKKKIRQFCPVSMQQYDNIMTTLRPQYDNIMTTLRPHCDNKP